MEASAAPRPRERRSTTSPRRCRRKAGASTRSSRSDPASSCPEPTPRTHRGGSRAAPGEAGHGRRLDAFASRRFLLRRDAMARKQQEGGKGVLEDKKQFERSAADQKLSHMGDK